jgi:glycerophosphoryl diester phosphodiesterase
MKRRLQIVAILIGLATTVNAGTQCIAHRGFSARYPENSLEAITNGWRAGASIVEVDVRMTRDQQLVLHHDAAVNSNIVAELNLSDLRDHRPDVVLLTDVLQLANATNQLLLDIKANGATFTAALHQLIVATDTPSGSLLLQSPSLDALDELGRLMPDLPRFYVSKLKRKGLRQRTPSATTLHKTMKDHKLSGVTIKGRRFITRRYLAVLKQDGRKVFIWTINDPNRISHYLKIGADGIITDNPTLLPPHTQSRSR